MSTQLRVAAQDLRDGDIVDLLPVLNDPVASPWIHQPFGPDDAARQAAIESARVVAQYENATAERSQVEGDVVMIYTDTINIAVPLDYQVTIVK